MLNARILIGICSCHRYAERRDAVRETWLDELPKRISARFFTGEGESSTEEDLSALSVSDDYPSLPKKVQAFFRTALEYCEFDYLFKCDDDTYVFCERLFDLVRDGVEFVGSADFWPRHADGGAGYLLSRRAVGIIAAAQSPGSGPEDVWVSEVLKNAGVEFLSSDRLIYDYHRIPSAPARIITTHHCAPEMLRRIHRWWPERNAEGGEFCCFARHATWQGPLKLLANGFFAGGVAGPNGRWEFVDNGELLVLEWFDWPKDSLRKDGLGYSNQHLSIEILSRRLQETWSPDNDA